MTTILPQGHEEIMKNSTILHYLNTFEEYVLGKNLALRAKMKSDILKSEEN